MTLHIAYKPHLSISQLEMFAKCPKQWEYRYVYGIKTPPGVAATVGKGTHAANEKDLRQKMDWGVLMTEDEVKDTAADSLRAAWEREQPVVRDGDLTQGQAVDQTVALTSLYHRLLAPKLEPVALERAFLIEIPDLAHDVMGVVDVETPTMIRDTKTSKRSPDRDAAARSPQLAAYHLRATLDGQPGKGVALDYLVKNQRPTLVTVEATPTEDDHNAFLGRVALASQAITAGVFPPTSPSNWWCTQKWCGYWDRCEFGARQRVSAPIPVSRLTSRCIPNPHEDTKTDSEE